MASSFALVSHAQTIPAGLAVTVYRILSSNWVQKGHCSLSMVLFFLLLCCFDCVCALVYACFQTLILLFSTD